MRRLIASARQAPAMHRACSSPAARVVLGADGAAGRVHVVPRLCFVDDDKRRSTSTRETETFNFVPDNSRDLRGQGQAMPVRREPCLRATAGRPPAGRPGLAAPLPGDRPLRTCALFFLRNFFQKYPCRPAAGRPGYIPVNFENENIFL